MDPQYGSASTTRRAGIHLELDRSHEQHQLDASARMKVVRTVSALRAALSPARTRRLEIGLVPTMGALHDGHLALIERARAQCDVVVVSLFVNPAQFNERADLERYPRRERDDVAAAAAAGADVLFAPSVEEIYPRGFATSVEVLDVTERLEGEARGSEHFRGVATVVTKLLCMALPDVAYFGQKDAQQVFVIRRLVADLNLPVQIDALPTVREPDGLAMSSRNALLAPNERARALALPAALEAARALTAAGERSAQALLDAARAAMRPFGVEPEYVALVDPESFEPIGALTDEALLALAARVGEIRLIDNTTLSPAASHAATAAHIPVVAQSPHATQSPFTTQRPVAMRTPHQPLEGEAIATCSA
jgi:pantoate--beta-alanine ligase